MSKSFLVLDVIRDTWPKGADIHLNPLHRLVGGLDVLRDQVAKVGQLTGS